MSYIPNVWQAGDVVTPAKLNHIEEGIANSGGGSLVVHIVGDSPVTLALDKTWQEIYDALVAGRYVLGLDQYEGGVTHQPIENAEIDGSDYKVSVGNQLYTANSADGYPAWSAK